MKSEGRRAKSEERNGKTAVAHALRPTLDAPRYVYKLRDWERLYETPRKLNPSEREKGAIYALQYVRVWVNGDLYGRVPRAEAEGIWSSVFSAGGHELCGIALAILRLAADQCDGRRGLILNFRYRPASEAQIADMLRLPVLKAQRSLAALCRPDVAFLEMLPWTDGDAVSPAPPPISTPGSGTPGCPAKTSCSGGSDIPPLNAGGQGRPDRGSASQSTGNDGSRPTLAQPPLGRDTVRKEGMAENGPGGSGQGQRPNWGNVGHCQSQNQSKNQNQSQSQSALSPVVPTGDIATEKEKQVACDRTSVSQGAGAIDQSQSQSQRQYKAQGQPERVPQRAETTRNDHRNGVSAPDAAGAEGGGQSPDRPSPTCLTVHGKASGQAAQAPTQVGVASVGGGDPQAPDAAGAEGGGRSNRLPSPHCRLGEHADVEIVPDEAVWKYARRLPNCPTQWSDLACDPEGGAFARMMWDALDQPVANKGGNLALWSRNRTSFEHKWAAAVHVLPEAMLLVLAEHSLSKSISLRRQDRGGQVRSRRAVFMGWLKDEIAKLVADLARAKASGPPPGGA